MELKEQILKCFADLQCWADEEVLILNDEASVMTYRHLEGEVHLAKKELQSCVISLRNEGFIELVTAFDRDYEHRAGSGYFLTEEGRSFCQENKLSDGLTPNPQP